MGMKSEKIAFSIGMILIAMFVIGNVAMGVTYNSGKVDAEKTVEQEKVITERIVTETKKETISFDTKTVNDETIEYGKTVVRTEGVNGEKTYTYNVTYKGDKEILRELIKEEVTRQPVTKVIANGTKIIWRCVDVTSYNKNPYDDNKCTSSTGEVRYVSDSQSRALDPSYSPGKSGHYYYNSK